MKRVALILILTLLFFSLSPTTVAGSYTNVTVSEAKAMIDSKPSLVVLDVRTQSEYDSGHIRSAKLIPVSELGGRLDELNKTDEILVYCFGGARSSTASQLLADNGFLYIYNMLGGISAWISAGYHVYVKYSSIQEAINVAKPGDTIRVSMGTYYENVLVNKTVSLVGESKIETIVDGGGVGTVVNVTANSVVINGFTVRNSGQEAGGDPDSEMDSGICVHMADNVSIVDNLAKYNADGIRLYESSNSNISRNIAESNARYGILLYNCTNNYLRNNIMADNEYNFGAGGYIQHFMHDMDTSNTVNGKPVYYWINQKNKIIPEDAGYVELVNCTGITVMDLNLSNNRRGVGIVLGTNSTVRNVNAINNALDGILLYEGCSNITVTGCTSVNNMHGIRLVGAKDNTIVDNVAMNNTVNGICLSNSNDNTIINNQALNNTWEGIGLWNSVDNTIRNNVAEDNGDNGIYLYNSNNNAIGRNQALNNSWHGISLGGSDNNTITDNWAANNARIGIGIWDSTKDTVSGNVAENHVYEGIYLCNSTDNAIAGNRAFGNYHGISLDKSYNNLIGSNTVANNTWQGIGLWRSVNNTVRSNVAENNGESGFYLYNSTENVITGNTAIRNKRYGIWTEEASNNLIYDNDFIDNKVNQTYNTNSVNAWDKDYEYGGNYWSDYKGEDEFSGPNQNIPESDGIGDTPYIIDPYNQDRYPRMTTLVYDVTLINVTSPLHIYIGWTVDITVTVKNNGYTSEDFIVIAYYDNNTIGRTTILGLAPGKNVTLAISWDTTDLQLYTEYKIWAEAIPVPGETSIEDNTLVKGAMIKSIPGDVDADRDVDLYDVVKICSIYGVEKGDPKYVADYDVNGDDKIDLYDVVIACTRYGEKV
jgi:parallel beta-helix repeat protein